MDVYAIYDTTTGNIVRKVTVTPGQNTDTAAANCDSGQTYLLVAGDFDPALYYIDTAGPTLTLRVLLNTVATWSATTVVADGISTITLSGLPNPSTIQVINSPLDVALIHDFVVTDGSLVFATSSVGSYTINAQSFPYADFSQDITAT